MKHFAFCLSLCYFAAWNTPFSGAQWVVAHRGASQDAPENTLAAFRLAWEQDADAIEGDFLLTSDRQIVCFHDAGTKRLCGVKRLVAESTLAELQTLDVGSWKDKRFANEHMPNLSDVLALVPSDKKFFLEIKCGPEIVPFLPRILQESGIELERVFIISFNKNVIRAAKERMPEQQAYWLVTFHQDKQQEEQQDGQTRKWAPTVEEVIATAQEINADGVDLNANTDVVNAAFVDRCHQAGLSVHVWTVDDLEKAIKLQKMGVDSITTNRPGYLRRGLFPRKPALPSPSNVLFPSSIPANSEAQVVPTTVP